MTQARSALGRRIIVTGLAGSGKSTLSLALASKTGLPLVHLDLEFWQPGWTAPSEAEFRETQTRVLAGDAWIADGNYHETLDLRLERADTVVALDLPWWLCVRRALLRGFRMPGALPPGCDYSRWERLRDEWKLAFLIWRNRRFEPQRERELIAQHGQHVALYVLTSKREVADFLGGAHLIAAVRWSGSLIADLRCDQDRAFQRWKKAITSSKVRRLTAAATTSKGTLSRSRIRMATRPRSSRHPLDDHASSSHASIVGS
jgi:adenylate kinase family enzyme